MQLGSYKVNGPLTLVTSLQSIGVPRIAGVKQLTLRPSAVCARGAHGIPSSGEARTASMRGVGQRTLAVCRIECDVLDSDCACRAQRMHGADERSDGSALAMERCTLGVATSRVIACVVQSEATIRGNHLTVGTDRRRMRSGRMGGCSAASAGSCFWVHVKSSGPRRWRVPKAPRGPRIRSSVFVFSRWRKRGSTWRSASALTVTRACATPRRCGMVTSPERKRGPPHAVRCRRLFGETRSGQADAFFIFPRNLCGIAWFFVYLRGPTVPPLPDPRWSACCNPGRPPRAGVFL